jgi:hypothetical protein
MMCGGMMLLLISGAISNSNAVIRQEFRKLRLQMIDDNSHLFQIDSQQTHFTTSDSTPGAGVEKAWLR